MVDYYFVEIFPVVISVNVLLEWGHALINLASCFDESMKVSGMGSKVTESLR